jgi:hypothetical protein
MMRRHKFVFLFFLLFWLALPALACQSAQSGIEAIATALVTAAVSEESSVVDEGAKEPGEVVSRPTSGPTRTLAPTITPEASGAPIPPTPTATPVPPTATPTPVPAGMSRSNPFPFGQLVQAPNWHIQVLQLLRGEEAWAMIAAANMFNKPAPEGMEYVLVKLYVQNSRQSGNDAGGIGNGDFKVTGSRHTLYRNPFAVPPSPILRAEVYPGGEIEGWAVFMVHEGEDKLVLVFDELVDYDRSNIRFLALSEGAAVQAPEELSAIQPNEAGLTRDKPAAFGETIITEKWQITVLDVVLGSEAEEMVLNANMFNDPPDEGMEYVVIKLRVHLIGQADEMVEVSGSDFRVMGSRNVIYDLPTAVDPEPGIRAHLYPGGVHEGWHVVQVTQGERALVLVYSPLLDFSGRVKRFLALE